MSSVISRTQRLELESRLSIVKLFVKLSIRVDGINFVEEWGQYP